MKLILISPPDRVAGEIPFLRQLLEEGLTSYHLRKPDWKQAELAAYLREIPAEFHSRIMLHSHFELLDEFSLQGAHVKSGVQLTTTQEHHSYSAPVHGFEEVLAMEQHRHYVLLSPIFNSISKAGYLSRFSLPECAAFFKQYKGTLQVIALGGIKLGKIKAASEAGFHGVAVLGAVWEVLEQSGPEAAHHHFKELQAEADACEGRPFPQRVRLI